MGERIERKSTRARDWKVHGEPLIIGLWTETKHRVPCDGPWRRLVHGSTAKFCLLLDSLEEKAAEVFVELREGGEVFQCRQWPRLLD